MVVLRSPSGKDITSFVERMVTQRVTDRQYLSREGFALEHSADRADILKIERFANDYGLTVVELSPAQHSVRLIGTVDTLAKAFNVELSIYEYVGGRYRGRVGPIYVPSELDGIVRAVIGLDARPQGKPHCRQILDPGGGWLSHAVVSFTPVEVANLYTFPQGLNGQGQCVGILEFGGGFNTSDLSSYFQRLGIPMPHVVAISVGQAINSPSDPNGPDAEVMLDIEVIGAVAPGAQIVVYFAPNTTLGWLQAVSRAIHDTFHNPSVISISWGGPEESWSRQALQALDAEFQVAAAMGITICAAAGNNGYTDGVHDRLAHVDFPASSPYVLACGGTCLESTGTGIASETVWNDGPIPTNPSSATGGGVSAFFPLPSYQINANVPTSVNPPHNPGRGVPDVAGDADPTTGYFVRVDPSGTSLIRAIITTCYVVKASCGRALVVQYRI